MRSTAGCLILIILLGASMSKAAIEVKFAKMSADMQKDAQHQLLVAQLIYKGNSEIANYIAKEFDRKHGGTWNAVVGIFGNHITSSSYICFYDGSKYTLLFKH
ncbi:dynein light chain 2, cytoplasmic-like [Megalobrama amblycephala]|uniref:dynein light chain 2, cytoplasmic-like n=1 Tax=Megalobrama amblycephala TaxID=75352 RepID=UPI0020140C56|nr:dynein light chain 2, cytoplasmic-like [Megalobrama amblycephala]